MLSDGCTGFQWLEPFVPGMRACCVIHDAGGSDGGLLDCLEQAFPSWTWPLVALAIAGMILIRPIYRRFFKRTTKGDTP